MGVVMAGSRRAGRRIVAEQERESPLYSDRERAALAWAEALTLLAATGAPDADYDLLKSEFTESEQVNLTLLIGVINLWNRLQVGLRAVHPVGTAREAA